MHGLDSTALAYILYRLKLIQASKHLDVKLSLSAMERLYLLLRCS